MSKVRKLDSLGVSAFCESMGLMARAGIQTDEAIALLGQSKQTEGTLGTALEQMKQSVEQGQGLSQAMEDTGIFPNYALKMIRAGESAGRLEDVLMRLADYYRDQKTIGEKLKAAVTYPAAMLVMIIIVLIVMLAKVLPTFTEVYDRMTGSLAASSYSYIQWAYGFCWVALIVMILLAIVLLLGRAAWNSEKRGGIEKLLRRIPICEDTWRAWGSFASHPRWRHSWPAGRCRTSRSMTASK